MLYTGISFCIILIKSDNVITKRVIRQILQQQYYGNGS